jgi:hypothetical protein
MEKKDIVIALFGAAMGLAGILLVVVGFIYSHSETLDLEDDRRKYKVVAKIGMAPFLLSFVCALFGVHWMLYQTENCFLATLYSFYLNIGATALYGVVAFLFYL